MKEVAFYNGQFYVLGESWHSKGIGEFLAIGWKIGDMVEYGYLVPVPTFNQRLAESVWVDVSYKLTDKALKLTPEQKVSDWVGVRWPLETLLERGLVEPVPMKLYQRECCYPFKDGDFLNGTGTGASATEEVERGGVEEFTNLVTDITKLLMELDKQVAHECLKEAFKDFLEQQLMIGRVEAALTANGIKGNNLEERVEQLLNGKRVADQMAVALSAYGLSSRITDTYQAVFADK